jgi:hypothetical protein
MFGSFLGWGYAHDKATQKQRDDNGSNKGGGGALMLLLVMVALGLAVYAMCTY